MKQTELNLILEQHRLWVDGKGGKCANLGGADLYRANLNDANLKNADLWDANLWVADLWDANLTGANLEFANLYCANLTGADLTGANLTGAYLKDANLSNAILPDISWIIPGYLAQLNKIRHHFYLEKENKMRNFVQDSFGFIIQDNREEKTFDMLVEDRIIRNIPIWVKYSGLKQVLS